MNVNPKRMSVKLQRLLMLMAAIMMALVTFTACEEEENGDDQDGNGGGINSNFAEKAAVKYLIVQLLPIYDGLPVHRYVIYDNYGKRYREDTMGPYREDGGDYISLYDFWETYIENHINKTIWRSWYKGKWEDEPYKTKKTLETTWLGEFNMDGFKKQSGQITFAGKSCDVYILTTSTPAGEVTDTYYLWNKIVMMGEKRLSGEILARHEAVAISLDVPEVAFTKTFDITWLPL